MSMLIPRRAGTSTAPVWYVFAASVSRTAWVAWLVFIVPFPVPLGTMGTKRMVPTGTMSRGRAKESEDSVRQRILHAAMGTFMEHGFANATTLEIATRAKVSKR